MYAHAMSSQIIHKRNTPARRTGKEKNSGLAPVWDTLCMEESGKRAMYCPDCAQKSSPQANKKIADAPGCSIRT